MSFGLINFAMTHTMVIKVITLNTSIILHFFFQTDVFFEIYGFSKLFEVLFHDLILTCFFNNKLKFKAAFS